jgi:hypothetical protein
VPSSSGHASVRSAATAAPAVGRRSDVRLSAAARHRS